MKPLKAPFPAFGGKSRIASEVWARFGDPRNFIEPFCFSAAMLLKRPGGAGPIETINDLNCYVANFWRAVQADPAAVAAHADWPVNETDLHARHKWLVKSDAAQQALQKVKDDPDYFDAKIAGWWCWGACCWIGSGWCDESHRNQQINQRVSLTSDGRPQLCCGNTTHGTGVNANALHKKRPRVPRDSNGNVPGVLNGPNVRQAPTLQQCAGGGQGVNGVGSGVARWGGPNVRQPALGQAGWGINAGGRPQLADAFARGRGVNGNDALSTCEARRQWITDWMLALSDRLRAVRVCCGHWSRVCDSESTMTRLGLTAVFLDPPYRKRLKCGKANRSAHIYANDKMQDVTALCDEVQAWCLRWGGNEQVRIALCGLEGEYPEIEAEGSGWDTFAWKSNGGYGNRNKANENRERERVWFSQHCLNDPIDALPYERPSCVKAEAAAA